jgi:CheY-like chemotaxis protein
MSAATAAAATRVDPHEAACPLNADASWGVIIVYDDAPAGTHALHTLEEVTRQLAGGIELYPSLWRFDLLEDPDWRAAATAEAVQAGLVIISTSSKGELPAPVRDWVRGCLQARTSAPGALVALLGPADDPDGADSPRIQFLKSAAEATGLGFFAPTPHAATPPVIEAPPDLGRLPARFAHRILLIEDESAMLQFNTLVLIGGGYHVTAVEGCEAAWEAIQSASYDLLVTDNQMPGKSGLELVNKLRLAQIGLPIIVASGGVEAETFTRNQLLQPAIALPKPFTANQLLATVAETLRRAGRDPDQTEGSLSASGDAYSHWGLNE